MRQQKAHLYRSHGDHRGAGQTEYEFSHSTACGYVRDRVTRDTGAVTCELCLREMVKVAHEMPAERECCGTFVGSHHRTTCPKYRGKFRPYNPDADPAAGKPWPTGLDAGRMGAVTPNDGGKRDE